MSVQNTETTERGGDDRREETGALSRAKRAGSTVARYGRSGPAATLAGVALLAHAVRTTTRNRGRSRAAGQLLAGAALFGIGLRQRRAEDATTDDEDPSADSSEGVSADARAARERHDVMGQSETNPRGTSGEPDVETRTDPDEGDIRFSEEQGAEPGPKPRLDEEDPKDPRFEGADDEGVEIDLSEASMADEASEATGPTPGQAQPVQTEDTEPEPSPPEDASHTQADVPGGSSADADAERESDETDGGDRSEATQTDDSEGELAEEVINHLADDEDDGSDDGRDAA